MDVPITVNATIINTKAAIFLFMAVSLLLPGSVLTIDSVHHLLVVTSPS